MANNKKRLASLLAVTLVSSMTVQLFSVQPLSARDSEWRRLTNSGNDSMSAGNYAEAEDSLKKALKEAERVRFEDDMIAESLSNLGRFYKRKRDLAAAEEHYRKALAQRKSTLDPLSESVARNLEDLCYCLYDQDKYEQMKPLVKEWINVRNKQVPADYDAMERPVSLMARMYRETNEYGAAREYLDRVMELRKKGYGDSSDKVADTRDDIARVYKDERQFERARLQFEEALTIRKKVFGPKHLNVARNIDEIAWCYQAERLFAKAAPLLQESLAMRKELLGDNSPRLARSMRELSRCYDNNEDITSAVAIAQDEVNLLKGLSGDHSLEVADALEHSSYEQRKAKHLDAAIKELKEALKLRERALTETHVDVARTLQRLANFECENQNFEDAIAHLTKQESILRQLVGTEHPDYLSCQRELKSAQAKVKEGKPSKINEAGAMKIETVPLGTRISGTQI